jgi:hypothetical protein
MRTNNPAPNCAKCGKSKKFVLVETGGRKFRCLDCDGEDLLQSPDVQRLLAGDKVRPPQLAAFCISKLSHMCRNESRHKPVLPRWNTEESNMRLSKAPGVTCGDGQPSSVAQ